MAKYRLQSPDGGVYDVEAPDSATEQEVMEYAQANFGNADKPIRNTVMDTKRASAAVAQSEAYTKRRQHLERLKTDPYYAVAQEQNPMQNFAASVGGALKGMGYVGPRQILGKTKPGEYEDWKAGMNALQASPGGGLGAFAGYAGPMVAMTPLTGASVPLNMLVAGTEAFLDPADSNAQRTWKTGIGVATAGAGQKFANAIGGAATNARATRQLRSYPGAETVREKTLRNTLEKGYKLPPSAAGKQSLLEATGGQIKTQQAMSDFNQKLTDNLVRKEMENAARFGFLVTPNTPLTSETMKGIRQAAGRPYQQIRELGELPTGDMQTVTKMIKSKLVDKSGNALKTPVKIQEQAKINATQAIDDLKQLRHDGYQQLSASRISGNPEALAQARQMLDEAASIEKRLEDGLQRAGKKELLDDLKAARELIAKSHNVQDAIRDSVGSVDARDIGALYEAGEKGYGPRLTGEIANIGKAGSAFRESMALRGFDAPRYSALDMAVGGMNMANAGSPTGMLMGGLPLLRGPARDRLMSTAYQKKLMPSSVPPGELVKLAPWLFDYTPNIPGLGPVPLSRGIPPALLMGGLLANTPE